MTAGATVVEQAACWAVAARALPLPPEVLHHARRALVDWVAAALAGAGMAPVPLLAA